MATTRIYLVRHGATQLTVEDRFSGTTGDLSDAGRAQIARLGERLRGERIQALYASPLSRALDSARILGAAIALEPELRDGLREIDHGHWEGLTHAEVSQRYGDEYAAWQRDPFGATPSGGESGASVLARASAAMQDILSRSAGQRVVVVSHKATIRLLICEWLGIDPRGYRERLDQQPACLDVLDFEGGASVAAPRARLMLFNDISHYAGG
jgi:probable phosphoglycerate mutase